MQQKQQLMSYQRDKDGDGSFLRNKIKFHPVKDKKHNRVFLGEQLFPKEKQLTSNHVSLPKISSPRHHNNSHNHIQFFYNPSIEGSPPSSPKRHNFHKRSISSYNVTDFQPKKIRSSDGDEGQVKLYKYLSSKVDFFNEENERRLRLKKRKALIDKGVIKTQKDKFVTDRDSKVPPAMVKLLKGYLEKRSLSQIKDEAFFVLGKDY